MYFQEFLRIISSKYYVNQWFLTQGMGALKENKQNKISPQSILIFFFGEVIIKSFVTRSIHKIAS